MTSATLNMLTADKLNSNNYASWKNTINTVLIIDDLRFVLVEECPQVLTANVTWNLAKKHESMLTAREIMDYLQEMFEMNEAVIDEASQKWKKKKGGQGNKANSVAAKTSKKAKRISSWWQLETGEMTMRVGTGHVVSAITVGWLRLCL
ncbi:gag/pol protein [Cucumis melo var. makuwa]|uniref:Gag/pol protein n=1 Tax=Cucumis melo var. makuwa TaxID=1194695 RepID=A0A5A7UM63_CUCMM|nr:gag/pol protein [Cucumis melo var. makuwa]